MIIGKINSILNINLLKYYTIKSAPNLLFCFNQFNEHFNLKPSEKFMLKTIYEELDSKEKEKRIFAKKRLREIHSFESNELSFKNFSTIDDFFQTDSLTSLQNALNEQKKGSMDFSDRIIINERNAKHEKKSKFDEQNKENYKENYYCSILNEVNQSKNESSFLKNINIERSFLINNKNDKQPNTSRENQPIIHENDSIQNVENEKTNSKIERLSMKNENSMFFSQDPNLRSKELNSSNNFKPELDEFVLSKEVCKRLEESERQLKNIEAHVKIEKEKIDRDLNEISQNINKLIEMKGRELHSIFDNYLTILRNNYEHFKKEIRNYKSLALDQKNPNKNISVFLKNIVYFDTNTNENLVKLKEENCKIEIKVSDLKKEINKRTLNFFADELNKQTTHLPLYNHSECSQIFLSHTKLSLLNNIQDSLMGLNNLIYMNNFIDLKKINVDFDCSSIVSEDNSIFIRNFGESCLANFKISKKIQTDHFDEITSILPIENNYVCTGSKDKTIKIWNIDLEKKIGEFTGHDGSVTCLQKIILNSNELDRRRNILKKILGKEIEIKENFILSGSSDNTIKLWNLNLKNLARNINIHNNSITGIISCKDQRSFISCSSDKTIKLFDILNETIIQNINAHHAPIKSIIIFNDNIRFATADEEGIIIIWKMVTSFCINYQRFLVKTILMEKIIKNEDYIDSMINSALNFNYLIVAGKNGRIKIWNYLNGNLIKEISNLKLNAINGMNIFENIYSKNENRDRNIICYSEYGNLKKLNEKSNKIEEIILEEFVDGRKTNGIMKIIKDKYNCTNMIITGKNETILIIKIN